MGLVFVFVFLTELLCQTLWFEQDQLPELHEVLGVFARGEPKAGHARLGCAVLLLRGSEHGFRDPAEVRKLWWAHWEPQVGFLALQLCKELDVWKGQISPTDWSTEVSS